MGRLSLLLKREAGVATITVPLDAGETAGSLKAKVAAGVGNPRVSQVTWQGTALADGDKLEAIGIGTDVATIEHASQQLFPQGWFPCASGKAYNKVRDPTWPPMRNADYSTVGVSWVVALLVALLVSSAVA